MVSASPSGSLSLPVSSDDAITRAAPATAVIASATAVGAALGAAIVTVAVAAAPSVSPSLTMTSITRSPVTGEAEGLWNVIDWIAAA